MPKKSKYVKLKSSYTSKYQKHIACSYGYNLVCVDEKLSEPFETYLGEDAVLQLY